MEKKFKYAKISLIDLCFKCENLPEIMAEGIFTVFTEIVFPVFPDNGNPAYNSTQERARSDWLYRFFKKLNKKTSEWLELNKQK